MRFSTIRLLKALSKENLTPEEQFRVALQHDMSIRYTTILKLRKETKSKLWNETMGQIVGASNAKY